MKVNLPQIWPWKQNGTTTVAAVMILKVVNNWRIVLNRLWTLITFHYRKCMLPLQYLSECCLHNIYVWQKFFRKIISYWVIIWIKLKVLWLLWAFYSTLPSSGPQRQRQLMAAYFRPRLSPDNKIGHSQTTKVAFKSWIQPWKHKTTYWETWNVSEIFCTKILRINIIRKYI